MKIIWGSGGEGEYVLQTSRMSWGRQKRGHYHLLSIQRGEREERNILNLWTIQIAHREGGYLSSEMPSQMSSSLVLKHSELLGSVHSIPQLALLAVLSMPHRTAPQLTPPPDLSLAHFFPGRLPDHPDDDRCLPNAWIPEQSLYCITPSHSTLQPFTTACSPVPPLLEYQLLEDRQLL